MACGISDMLFGKMVSGTVGVANTIAVGTVSLGNTIASGTVSLGNTITSGTVNLGNTIATGTINLGKDIGKCFWWPLSDKMQRVVSAAFSRRT
jgi:hypothetical protein